MMQKIAITLFFLFSFLSPGLFAPRCQAAEVIIVADTKLKPAAEVIAGIRKTLWTSTKIYTPADVKGKLRQITEKEGAKVVIALGREALDNAMQLPPAIPVIYDLVVTPPSISRPNTTGFYMATPAREYIDLIRSHLHSIKQIAVVGSRDQLLILASGESPHMTPYSVKNTVEFVNTVKQLNSANAILLLPDSSLLTATAMEEAYLFSFRKGIPLLGISEKSVREGALLALVVDMGNVGRLIGEYATNALKGMNLGNLPPSPPRRFELYLNTETARKMGIRIPDEMIRMAKKAYP